MNYIKNKFYFLVSIIFFIIMSGCILTAVGSYQPTGIPLEVSVNSNGEISFSVKGEVSLPTPLGTFSVGVVANPADYFQVSNTLKVRVNCETEYFYDLHGNDFDLTFQAGYYQKINLQKVGTNLYLDIGNKDVSCPPLIAQVSPVPPSTLSPSMADQIEEKRQAQLEIGIANLKQYRGEISLANNQATINNEYFRVNSLTFADNGIRISFDSESSTGQWYNTPDRSCIIWQSNDESVSDAGYWNTSGNDFLGNPLLITNGLVMHAIENEITSERLGNTDPNIIESGLTVYHYEGYLLFPYTILPNNVRLLKADTAYYFSYGCAVFNPQIVLFDILDFSQ